MNGRRDRQNDVWIVFHSHVIDFNFIQSFQLGWFAHPIFSEGNYPAVMISLVGNNSIHEGRSASRLPTFSEEWIAKIRGSADFFGINYYTSVFVNWSNGSEEKNPSYQRDRGTHEFFNSESKPSILGWLKSYPKGLGDILR